MSVVKLLNVDLQEASLEEVCAWIVETYPADVFVCEPSEVVTMRSAAQDILKKLKYRK